MLPEVVGLELPILALNRASGNRCTAPDAYYADGHTRNVLLTLLHLAVVARGSVAPVASGR